LGPLTASSIQLYGVGAMVGEDDLRASSHVHGILFGWLVEPGTNHWVSATMVS
jgi:hypothetical protein